jgi:hypothetical protein
VTLRKLLLIAPQPVKVGPILRTCLKTLFIAVILVYNNSTFVNLLCGDISETKIQQPPKTFYNFCDFFKLFFIFPKPRHSQLSLSPLLKALFITFLLIYHTLPYTSHHTNHPPINLCTYRLLNHKKIWRFFPIYARATFYSEKWPHRFVFVSVRPKFPIVQSQF